MTTSFLALERAVCVLCSLMIVLLLAGCGGKGAGEIRLTPVEGKIELDGKPLGNAVIQLHFKGKQPEGYQGGHSLSDEDGHFQVKSGERLGTLQGPHVVTVISGEGGSTEIPKMYGDPKTSKLEIDVREEKAVGYSLQLSSGSG